MIGTIYMGIIVGFEGRQVQQITMKTRKLKIRCVCSVVNKISILYGHNLQGEIFFKHYFKCRFKTTGEYEWTGAGFEKLENHDKK